MNIGQITGGTAINIVPEQCRIRVGFRPLPGVDSMAKIDEINLNSLRSQTGCVPQEVFLFSDSIANNISFGIRVSRARGSGIGVTWDIRFRIWVFGI